MIRLSHKNSSNIRLYMMFFYVMKSSVKKDQTWKKSSLTYPTIMDSIYIYTQYILLLYCTSPPRVTPRSSPPSCRCPAAAGPPGSSRSLDTSNRRAVAPGRVTMGHHGSPGRDGDKYVKQILILNVIYIYICNIIVCI